MIEQRVSGYIERERLFSPKDKVLVALSGGADSVALLRVLSSLGYTCAAAHCNFRLRGEESARDEEFVKRLCEKFNVPLYTVRFDTFAYARERKISVEMAARELRYNWFEELRKQHAFSVVAVAHQLDDSVETVLLNLIRGTGINGLLGIRPKNKAIARPLLCLTREEILDYLKSIRQDFVTDSSNLTDAYTRNKIRLGILPLMQEINPSVKKSIAAAAGYLNGVNKICESYMRGARERVLTPEGISMASLLEETSPEAVLFEILYPLGFNASQIEAIYKSMSGQSGKVFISSDGWRVNKDREFLLIGKPGKDADTPPFRLTEEETDYTPGFYISKEKNTACFDSGKLQKPLLVRKWRKGDTFVPFGMKGKKLVSDYMTDRKFPAERKENQWLLLSNDRVAWVIGERTDERFRVDEQTKRITIFTLTED